MKPTVAIIGASADRTKFGNRAVRDYAQQGYEVFPINPRTVMIEGHQTFRSVLDVPAATLDRVSFYVPPEIGLQVIEEVAKKSVREVWLNPGAESPELIARAEALGLKVIVACSIVDIGENPHALHER